MSRERESYDEAGNLLDLSGAVKGTEHRRRRTDIEDKPADKCYGGGVVTGQGDDRLAGWIGGGWCRGPGVGGEHIERFDDVRTRCLGCDALRSGIGDVRTHGPDAMFYGIRAVDQRGAGEGAFCRAGTTQRVSDTAPRHRKQDGIAACRRIPQAARPGLAADPAGQCVGAIS